MNSLVVALAYLGAYGSVQDMRRGAFILSHGLVGLSSIMLFPLFFIEQDPWTFFHDMSFFWFISPMLLSASLLSGWLSYQWGCFLSALNMMTSMVFCFVLAGEGMVSAGPCFAILIVSAGVVGGTWLCWRILGASIVAVGSILGAGFYGTWNPDIFSTVEGLSSLFLLPVFLSGCAYYSMIAGVVYLRERTHAVHTDFHKWMCTIVDDAADLLTYHDRTGQVRYASAASMRLFSVSRDALQGDGMLECVHPEDQARFLRAILSAVHRYDSVVFEYRISHDRVGICPPGEGQYMHMEGTCHRSRSEKSLGSGNGGDGVVLVSRFIEESQVCESVGSRRVGFTLGTPRENSSRLGEYREVGTKGHDGEWLGDGDFSIERGKEPVSAGAAEGPMTTDRPVTGGVSSYRGPDDEVGKVGGTHSRATTELKRAG